jgi:DnaJ-domain-containing protein 1
MLDRIKELLGDDMTIVVIAWFAIGFGGVWLALSLWKRPGAGRVAEGGGRNAGGNRDWYIVLEVSPQASMDEIVAAYRARAAQYAPSAIAHLGPDFQRLAADKRDELDWALSKAKHLHGR